MCETVYCTCVHERVYVTCECEKNMGKSKRKNSPPTTEPTPSTQEKEGAPDDDKSESEFAAVEKSLEQSLSHDSLTWMRHVIRVQAAEVTKDIIRQEREKKSPLEANRIEMLSKQMDDLKKKLNDTQQEVDGLKAENVRRKREIERLEFTNSKKQAMIDDLRIKLDEIQQDKHEHSVQIVGFPENKSETDDIKNLTKVFKEKAGVKIKPTDIIEMRRRGKQNEKKTRNVILKFRDKATRQKIYNERKKLIIDGNPKKSVYVNDSLTQHRQELLYAARQLVKQKRLFAAWSQAGNILVRKTEDSSILQVRDHSDLTILKTGETEHVEDEDSSRQPEETSSEMTHLSGYSYYCDSDI